MTKHILIIATISALCISLHTLPSEAVPLVPHKSYTGPSTIEVTEVGMSFKLFKGWSGSMDEATGSFNTSKGEGIQVILSVSPVPLKQIRAEFERGIPLGNGIDLSPKGALKSGPKGRIEGSYGIVGVETLSAYIIAQPVKGSHPALIIALCTTAPLKECKGAANQFAESIKRIKGLKSTQGKPKGALAQKLLNKKLTRYHTVSGYSEKETITLCSDGRFFRSFNSGSLSINGSGAVHSGGDGRWFVRGETLILNQNDGQASMFSIQMSPEALLLDGTKWFREDTICH